MPQEGQFGTPVDNKKSSSRGSVGSACENIQSEMSAGGTKRDVENTPKCTRFNCNLWPHNPPARPCRPLAGFGIVIHKLSVSVMLLWRVDYDSEPAYCKIFGHHVGYILPIHKQRTQTFSPLVTKFLLFRLISSRNGVFFLQ